MNNFLTSFILTSMAGLSTLIGYFVVYIKGNQDKIINFTLSFSSAVMLTISLIDLLPSSISYLDKYMFIFRSLLVIFFVILGVYLSYFISIKVNKKEGSSLKKIGIISVIAIVLHNIPEGIITFMVSGVDIHLGIKLATAISMHNIPEGISIAIPLFYSTKNKIKTLIVVFLSGFSEILGGFFCYLFLKNTINNLMIGLCFSFIAGIMINISLRELLKEALEYQDNKTTFIGFLTGFIVMVLSHILF